MIIPRAGPCGIINSQFAASRSHLHLQGCPFTQLSNVGARKVGFSAKTPGAEPSQRLARCDAVFAHVFETGAQQRRPAWLEVQPKVRGLVATADFAEI